MDTQAQLHFFCGKMASGKSTLAKRLAEQHKAILLVEDRWLEQLYDDVIVDIPSYINYSTRLKQAMTEHIGELLSTGSTVILDFPANTVQQRSWFRQLFESAEVGHVLHFIDASDELCKQQLRQRSKNQPAETPFTSEAEFDLITQYFQPPSADEAFNIIHY